MIIYRLGTLHSADRAPRRAWYEKADPEGRWQSIGYDHLTDEPGLRLRPVAPSRDAVE